jgi:pimeloyl-ACP methyl ester carboxylesterase
MAEVLNRKGFSVVVTSSSMNRSFSEGAGLKIPGYVPDDAAAVRKTIRLILDDLRANTELKPERIAIGGYSLGGLHTLHIAAMEAKENTLGADRFVAINPPVDLMYAMKRFDAFTDVSKQWTKKEFFEYAGDGLSKYFQLLNRSFAPMPADAEQASRYQLSLSPEQAAVMAGLSFRMTLRELLISAHRMYGLEQIKTPYSWWNRGELYRELDQYDGMGYVEKFLLPEHRKKEPGATAEALNSRSGLRCLETFLKESPQIRVIHNLDDPILAPEDRTFLDDALGEKLTWFDCGGHMGNLFLLDHQTRLGELFGSPGILPPPEDRPWYH